MTRKKTEAKKAVGRPPKAAERAKTKPTKKLIGTTALIHQMQAATVSKLS